MEVEIEKEKENKLLKRREVLFRVSHDGGSPSREDVRTALMKTLRCNPKMLVIDWMRAEFGKRETVGYAKVYENEDRLKEIEEEHIIKRNFGEGAKEK